MGISRLDISTMENKGGGGFRNNTLAKGQSCSENSSLFSGTGFDIRDKKRELIKVATGKTFVVARIISQQKKGRDEKTKVRRRNTSLPATERLS